MKSYTDKIYTSVIDEPKNEECAILAVRNKVWRYCCPVYIFSAVLLV